MLAYDGILLDFDGTIADTSKGVIDSVEYALRKLNKPKFDREALRGFVGPALFVSFREITGLTESEAEKAIEFYREIYHSVGVFDCELYGGMKELIADLKSAGAKLAVASAKPQNALDTVVKHLGIEEYFDKVVGADPKVKHNDKEYILRRAIVGTRPIMVGDAPYDIIAAKTVGMPSVAAKYGLYIDKEQLIAAQPDYVAESVEDLRKILLG